MKEYKLVVMGSGGVGKSALVQRYLNGIFVERYDPTLEDSYRKQVEIDGVQRMLDVLDTAGSDQFAAMRMSYMQSGQAFVLVYSIVAPNTLTELKEIYEQIREVKDHVDYPIITVGAKADLEEERAVEREEGEEVAASFGKYVKFLEASSKTGDNVAEVFAECVRQYNAKEAADGAASGGGGGGGGCKFL